MNETEALADQWADLIDVAEFVRDQLTETALDSRDDDERLKLLDASRDISSTIRQAHKVRQTMGWTE